MAATLYINFQRADLSKREQVALSYAVNRLTDIQSRQGFYSNTFKLPDNARNREVFGWPHELNSTDTRRFTRLPAHIEADGVTVMQGFAEIRSAGGEIEAVVKAGNADWIADMKGKTIRDLDLSDLDHFPDEATVAANRFNTSADGFIYPDADYGPLRQLIEPLIPCWYLAPALFLKEVVARAFAQHGWTLVNELDGIETFENTVLPYVDHNLPHTEEWVDSKRFRANMVSWPLLFAASGSIVRYYAGFDTVDFDNSSQFTTSAVWSTTSPQAFYTPNEETRQEFKLTCTLNLSSQTVDGWVIIRFIRANYPAYTLQADIDFPTTFGGAGGVVELNDGSQIFMIRGQVVGDYVFTISSGLINTLDIQGVEILVQGSQLSVTSGQLWNEPSTQRLPRSYFSMARHAPDIKLTEVIKYMVNSYSAIIDADGVGKVVRIRRFDTIRTNPPVDWSNKLDLTDKPEHSFDFGGFQRVNVLEYDNDTDDRALVNDAELGRFEIASPHVDRGQSILYTAPFSLSQRTGAFAGQREVAVIDQYSAETKGVRVNAFELTVTAIDNGNRRVTVTGNATRLRSGDKVTFYGISTQPTVDDNGHLLNWNTLTVDEVESFTVFTVTESLSGSTATDGFAYCGAFGNYIKTGEMDAFAVGDQITLSGISSGDVHGLPVNVRPFTVTGISGETLIIEEPILTTTPHVGVAGTLVNTIREPYKPRKTTPRVARVQTVAGNEIQLLGTATVTDSSTLWHQYLHWEELAGDHWHTLTGIIADPQQVKVLMRLTAADINQLDFARPVWVEWFAAYFFLSFVNQFRADVVDSTEVELVKLPMP